MVIAACVVTGREEIVRTDGPMAADCGIEFIVKVVIVRGCVAPIYEGSRSVYVNRKTSDCAKISYSMGKGRQGYSSWPNSYLYKSRLQRYQRHHWLDRINSSRISNRLRSRMRHQLRDCMDNRP